MQNSDQYFSVKLSSRPRKLLGPLSIQDIKNELLKGTMSWTDLCWNLTQDTEWKRLFENPLLFDVMSECPPTERLEDYKRMCLDVMKDGLDSLKPEYRADQTRVVLENVQSSMQLPPLVAPVYVQISGSEFGPLSIPEFKNLLKNQKFNATIYVWYKGLKGWFSAGDLSLSPHLGEETMVNLKKQFRPVPAYKIQQGREARNYKRRSLVASVYGVFPQGRELLGVCADISRTGIHVWLEGPFECELNSEVNLEILPLSLTGIGTLSLRASLKWYKESELRAGFMFLGYNDDLPAYQNLLKFLDRSDAEAALLEMGKIGNSG